VNQTLRAAFEYPVLKLSGSAECIPAELAHVNFVFGDDEDSAVKAVGEAATAHVLNTSYNAGVWVKENGVVSEDGIKALTEWRRGNFIYYNASRSDRASDIQVDELRARNRETGAFIDMDPDTKLIFENVLEYQSSISSLIRKQFADVSVQPFIRSGEAHTSLSCGRPGGNAASIDLHYDSDGNNNSGLLFRAIETIIGPSTVICPDSSCEKGAGNALMLKEGACSYEVPNNALLSISHTAMDRPIAHGRPRAPLCSIVKGEEVPRVVLLWDVYKNMSPGWFYIPIFVILFCSNLVIGGCFR
tara:strand:+ start:967 stop:1872 length:906 start_codon:yes stop_codon:yes gene_type:complete